MNIRHDNKRNISSSNGNSNGDIDGDKNSNDDVNRTRRLVLTRIMLPAWTLQF